MSLRALKKELALDRMKSKDEKRQVAMWGCLGVQETKVLRANSSRRLSSVQQETRSSPETKARGMCGVVVRQVREL